MRYKYIGKQYNDLCVTNTPKKGVPGYRPDTALGTFNMADNSLIGPSLLVCHAPSLLSPVRRTSLLAQ